MKRSKKEKQTPNTVVFLVEGESDKIALELPLAEMIHEKFPEYNVCFLLQERILNKSGDEVEDCDQNDDEFIEEIEYTYGGDITSSSYVIPSNIETKITSRFIIPATKKEGIYPKSIAKIIHIVDLDGVYIPDENIVSYSDERKEYEKFYYDGNECRIETVEVSKVIERNERKRRNLEYLMSLQKIKIKSKSIPYEIYFFSSNLDHFINNDANIKSDKKKMANQFLYSYGLETEEFSKYFFNDEKAIGYLGYKESWDFIKEGTNSIKRYTNIDWLIRNLKNG